MTNQADSYKKILKSTSIFGFVQLSTLLISIIRAKAVAVLIGPAGYGIYGLLLSGIDLIVVATGMGIETSGVKSIAEKQASSTPEKVAEQSTILLKLAWLLGIAGAVITIIFSGQLSIITFGDRTYTWAFVWVSLAVLFKKLTSTQNAVLQGMEKLADLAKSNLYASIFGLGITLPLYYFLGLKGIVPVLIASSFIGFLIARRQVVKQGLPKTDKSWKETFIEGKEVIFFGGLLSLSSFLPLLSNYLIQIFINSRGAIEQVGFFNIGLVLLNTYVGVVFTAMSMEYYPRLASFSHDSLKVEQAVNQQASISVLILLPIIVLFSGFAPLFIKLFFSSEFQGAMEMVSVAIFAMFFKGISWTMGYVIIAKADSKVFMKTSVIFNTLYLIACVLGYYLDGLRGLGIGFLLYYIFHLLSVYFITKIRYKIRFEREFRLLFLKGLIFCFLAFLFGYIDQEPYRITLYLLLLVIVLFVSYLELNKRINIKEIVRRIIKKKS